MNRIVLVTVFVLSLLCNLSFAQITPQNDTLFHMQKDLFDKLNVLEAWKITKGNPDILIGCIDNGFDFFHPYLYDHLIPGYFADSAYHPMTFQTISHGTLVSSIMVANPKNENGMHGLSPECKVLTASTGSIEHFLLRRRKDIMKENPDMSPTDIMNEIVRKDPIAVQQFGIHWIDFVGTSIAKSINYLAQNRVKVINISSDIVSTVFPETNQKRIDKALEYARTNNVLVIISAGNNNKKIPKILKNNDNIIMVGASTMNDTRWTVTVGAITQGSNWGVQLDVCAPIEGLVVCQPSDNRFYKSDDGPMGAEKIPFNGNICDVMPYGATSGAAPIVTALAALVFSIAPDMTASDVKKVILQGCDDIWDDGIDIYTGHGRINFGKTISLVTAQKSIE